MQYMNNQKVKGEDHLEWRSSAALFIEVLRTTPCYLLNVVKNTAARGSADPTFANMGKNRAYSKNFGEGPTENYPLDASQWPSKVDYLGLKAA